jgi:hypothetical protein
MSLYLTRSTVKVVDFQPYYVFNKRHMSDLRIGATILQEHVDLETTKREQAEKSKREEKAAAEAAANKVGSKVPD